LTVSLPSLASVARLVVAVVAIAAIVFVGLRIFDAVRPDQVVSDLAFNAPLQQVRTVSEVYLGKVKSESDGYVRLVGPAVVREQPTASGSPSQVLVIRLTADPFDVDGDLLIPRENVVAIGNVARDSGLERAYRQAIGDLPQPTPGTPASTSP